MLSVEDDFLRLFDNLETYAYRHYSRVIGPHSLQITTWPVIDEEFVSLSERVCS